MSTRRALLSRLRVLSLAAVAATLSPHPQIQAAVVPPSATGTPPAVLTIEGLGKGVAPLDGPWQFHLGDDPTWATPGIDDATGHNGWEQLTTDAPWGTQGHPGYTGSFLGRNIERVVGVDLSLGDQKIERHSYEHEAGSGQGL
jgi:hypothetical protein